MPVVRPVILSGGSGTRLWPLSTSELPKQFVPLLSNESLFVRTLKRFQTVDGIAEPIVVTGASQTASVLAAASEADVPVELTIVEPAGRNTAPATLAAAYSVDPDEVLVILPADHLISDTAEFVRVVEMAVVEAVSESIVTFGIKPTGPETGYGYIEMGHKVGHVNVVDRFKEKPDVSEAKNLVADGRHVWNSGMFVAKAGVLVAEGLIHCPVLTETVRRSMPAPKNGVLNLDDRFLAAESISLDHAIMEKTGRAVVMPIEVGWSDIGSYETLWEASDKDSAGNAVSGDVVLNDVSDSLVRATSRTVAIAGMADVVVIETPDAVLVLPRDRSQDVKELAAEAIRNRSQSPS